MTTLTPGRQRLGRRALSVLIVEEGPDSARAMLDLLGDQAQVRAQAARDVPDALALLRAGGFDAALVDQSLWGNPETGLADLVRDARPDLAVVVVTGAEQAAEALPSLKLGAQDFVTRDGLTADQVTTRLLAAAEEARTMRRRETMMRWLEREARIDQLTGLATRRHFDDRLGEACSGSRSARQPVALLLANVSGTSDVNALYGYEAGDALIARAAAAVVRAVRAGDFAGRVGGDDFGVILEPGSVDLAKLVARRIVHAASAINSREPGQPPIVMTFGLASGSSCDPADLFTAAEDQLRSGRRARPYIAVSSREEEPNGPSVA